MIPAKVEQFLKKLNEPDFFISANRDACAEIHDLIRDYVENGTETIEVEINVDLLLKVEKVLREYVEKVYVYQTQRIDGQKVQRLQIIYNCIGEFQT